MAGIAAGRETRARGSPLRIVILDGARSIGAKILVAGGGRCNVTHDVVDEGQYAPVSARNSIRKVLGRLTVAQTIAFFEELGVSLKREETGKLFPETDRARSVLDALLRELARLDVVIHHPWRVDRISVAEGLFTVESANIPEPAAIKARRIILCTGGKSLPKSGSDGGGYVIARSLGHSMSARVFPALVPLILRQGHFLTSLSGIAIPATLEVRSPTRKRLVSFTNSLLFTHFGLSGPAALDVSRYYTDARLDDAASQLVVNFLPGQTVDAVDADLRAATGSAMSYLRSRLPDRLAEAILHEAGVRQANAPSQLPRDTRRRLAEVLVELPLPVDGDRGYTFAEVTAGGVPLAEIRTETMESRRCPGLHLCGEICDVDGRIGGFNFQWAWASGHTAGTAAAKGLMADRGSGDKPANNPWSAAT